MSERADVLQYDTGDAVSQFGLSLHHAQLAISAGSEKRCRQSYVDVLGMSEVRKPDVLAARVACGCGRTSWGIHLGVEDFQPARKAHPGILVASLDALARRLVEHGVAPLPHPGLGTAAGRAGRVSESEHPPISPPRRLGAPSSPLLAGPRPSPTRGSAPRSSTS
ncbi:MAG: hypothetical protein ACRDQ5_00940 [Sciscionella sp.]